MMNLFLLWGRPFMTGDGPKMVHFGPKMVKHGRLVNISKWSEMVNLDVFDHLGPFCPLVAQQIIFI